MNNKVLRISEEKKCELIVELKELKDSKLPDISNRLESTREEDFGEEDTDLSRLLEEKEAVTKRISEIEEILRTAEIIKDKKFCSPEKVELGSVLKIEQGDKVLDVKIVSSIEANPERNYISEESPLGMALLNAKVGDIVKLSVRDSKTKYKILEIC
jgi:transcription elongation factor GreA